MFYNVDTNLHGDTILIFLQTHLKQDIGMIKINYHRRTNEI